MKIFYLKLIVVLIILSLFTLSNVYAVDLFLSSSSASIDNEEVYSIDDGEATQEYSPYDNISDIDDAETIDKTYDENHYTADEEVITYGSLDSDDDVGYETTSATVTSTPTVTSTVKQDKTLSISDIINIILISVCIVLILLGIAILIRCK